MGEIKVGQLVCSKAGRDEGQYFLVIDIINESFVSVVDGKVRKIENPKKKNIKHLGFVPKVAVEIAEKLRGGKPLINAEIRKAIKGLGIDQD